MRRAACWLLCVLVFASLPQAAHAEKIAVLDVVVIGVPVDARSRFEESLEDGLRGAGFDVVPRTRVIDALVRRDAPEGCAFGPCLAAVGRALGVELVLVARITASGPSYSFVLTLVDTASGAPTVQVADSCEVCTLDEALAAATMSIVSLGTRTGSADAMQVLPNDVWRSQHARQRRSIRRAAWWLSGGAVAAALAGAVLLVLDQDEAGFGALGAAGGLGIAGGTLWLK